MLIDVKIDGEFEFGILGDEYPGFPIYASNTNDQYVEVSKTMACVAIALIAYNNINYSSASVTVPVETGD